MKLLPSKIYYVVNCELGYASALHHYNHHDNFNHDFN